MGSRLGLNVQSFSTEDITSSNREFRLCLLRSTCCCIRVINCSRSSSPMTWKWISGRNTGSTGQHLARLNSRLCLVYRFRAHVSNLLQPLAFLFSGERKEINLAQLIPASVTRQDVRKRKRRYKGACKPIAMETKLHCKKRTQRPLLFLDRRHDGQLACIGHQALVRWIHCYR